MGISSAAAAFGKLSPDKAVAIIGMACRFPGANSPEELWQLALAGRDVVGNIPENRKLDFLGPEGESPEHTKNFAALQAGMLPEIDTFDADFFQVTPREAAFIDPQQRLLMEVGWEALEDAGLPLHALEGSLTGVFMGQWTSDYESRMFQNVSVPNLYITTGGGRYASGARLSYALNLQGPCMTIDTACSSSLVAVHLARQSLLCGECELAMAGGVNLILQPQITIAYSRARILSPRGRCHFADADGDGYVRSEGCAVVILKRLDRALNDGDRVYAIVAGSAVNNDGRQGLFVAPSPKGQEAMLRQSMASAGIGPGDFDYYEAHGTGTAVGDPVELRALGQLVGIHRSPQRRLPVGSVKANIGHTEAVAGLAGLMKSVYVLKEGLIPPNPLLKSLNPKIEWDQWNLHVPTRTEELEKGQEYAIAGVNSFGVTGTNAQVILQEPPMMDVPTADATVEVLVPISAKSPAALEHTVLRWQYYFKRTPAESIQDVAYAAGARRMHFEHRAVFVGNDYAELSESEPLMGHARDLKLAWVFSGQGPQWWGMGQELMRAEPVFRAALEQVDAVFQPLAGWSILDEMSQPQEQSRIEQTHVAQPMMFALQVGLATLWRHWGIQPSAVVGHSLGEIAAAWASGALSLEQATHLVFHRGRLLQKATGKGRMAAAEMTEGDARELVATHSDRLWLAAINGPRSVTLSGDGEVLEQIEKNFEADQKFFRFLGVNYAFHSGYVIPHAEELFRELEALSPRQSDIPFVSSVTGEAVDGTDLNAAYWRDNVRLPVQFARAMTSLSASGCNAFLEIGPHPVLNISILQTVTQDQPLVAGSLKRDQPERREMLRNLGLLHVNGMSPDWEAVCRGRRPCVSLPHYAWQKQRYWFEETKPLAKARTDSAQVPTNLIHELQWREIKADGSGEPFTQQIFQAEVDDQVSFIRECLRLQQQVSASQPFIVLTTDACHRPDAPPQTWQAAFRAFARTLQVEHPDKIKTIADIAATDAVDADMRQLLSKVCVPYPKEVMLQSGQWLAPEIVDSIGPSNDNSVDLKGAWLLTGGYGALGLATARWLAYRGAKRLILCGRHGILDKDSEKKEVIRDLESRGVAILLPRLDAADGDQLGCLITELRERKWWPLTGIIHLAAVTEDRLGMEIDAESLQRVFSSKLVTAQNLVEIANSLPEMRLIFFSSIGSWLPQVGQASYAAANAGLDALSWQLRTRGIRATSINWGPWAQGGLAGTRGGQFSAQAYASMGISSIESDAAFKALEQVLALELPQAGIFPQQTVSQSGSQENGAQVDAGTQGAPQVVLELRMIQNPQDRRDRLESFLQTAVSKVTGQSPEAIDRSRSFGSMGFDSLMAFELKNRVERLLGLELPATVAWNYPSVSALSAHVASRLGLADETNSSFVPQSASPADETSLGHLTEVLTGVDELTEDEALRALLKKPAS